MRLTGARALITGSTAGIGRAIACRFASEGAAVCITGRDRARGQAVVDTVRDAGGTAHFIAADLVDEAAAEALVTDSVGSPCS
jgi:NAD(P)-dependent dehydrogenase (short-subunit alcohol dehydrogenase family)